MYDKLKNIISEAVRDAVNETSRRQKAQQAIQGKNRRVKTIGIISAQNPMGSDGSELPSDYNKRSHEELLDVLKNGQYRFYVTDGMYGSPERSVMVFNISRDELIKLAYMFNQESAIFVDMTNGDDVSYQYWEGDDHNSPLKLQREEHEIVDATNGRDFYTKISRKFKFRIPFFECVESYYDLIEARTSQYDVDRLITECVEPGWSGKHRYFCRGKLHGKLR